MEQPIPIVVETTIDYPTIKLWRRFNGRKNAIGLGVLFFALVLLLAMLLILALPASSNSAVTIFTVTAPMLLVAAYLLQTSGLVYSRRNFVRTYGDTEMCVTYTFGADQIEIQARGKGERQSITLEYGALREVCETRAAFYLYRTAGAAHIADKAGFKQGTVSALAALLRERLGEEYETFGL